MSRPPPTELLPVLCVEIDPRRCVGPSLGPKFPNFTQVLHSAGHLVAQGVSGRDKEENMAYNDLVRIADEIEKMVRTGRFDPDRLNALTIEERNDLNRYAIAKATRKGVPIPQWAQQQTIGPPQYAQPPYPPQAAYPPPLYTPPQYAPNAPPMQGPPQYPAGPVHKIPPPDASHAWTPATHGNAHGQVPTAVLYNPASSHPVTGVPLAPPHSVTRAPTRPVTRVPSVRWR